MPSTHTCLHHHVVFSTHNREPAIEAQWRSDLHAFLGGCLNKIGATPLQMGGTFDHVHLLAGLRATHSIAEVVREIKKASCRWLHETRHIRFQWQTGYGAFAVSRNRVERVAAYIAGQQEHHRIRTFQEEYVAFLRANGIAYDERYLW